MAGLVGVRWAGSRYIGLAEGVNWDSWVDGGGEEDVWVVTRWGEDVVGVVVLRFVREEGLVRGRRKGGRLRGMIRAWTVKLRYRRKGVGRGLLEEGVKVCVGRGVDVMEFAGDHASMTTLFFFIWSSFSGLSFDSRLEQVSC